MVELADTLDLGSSAARHAGSTPVIRTKYKKGRHQPLLFSYNERHQRRVDKVMALENKHPLSGKYLLLTFFVNSYCFFQTPVVQ